MTTNGMDKAKLTELLERVTSATGPDRGLDGLIARDVEGWIPHFALEGDDLMDWPWMGGHWHLPGDPDADDCQQAPSDEPPAYAASIDAALALTARVLPGVMVNINSHSGDGSLWQVMLTGEKFCLAELASTAPLAILAALLTALSQLDGGKP